MRTQFRKSYHIDTTSMITSIPHPPRPPRHRTHPSPLPRSDNRSSSYGHCRPSISGMHAQNLHCCAYSVFYPTLPALPTPRPPPLRSAQVRVIRGMLVVCGPSGVGKGTLIARLMAEHSDTFGFCVSHTTRGPRPGEQNGVHYHFTDR